jgi:flagellar biosynthesis repressor protein FlbT
MLIHLKRNERLFLNGAVIRLEKRGTIELMNDAQFLLESHIMQAGAATTPLRQLYFVVQTMIMDPANARLTLLLFEAQATRTEACASTQTYLKTITDVRALVGQQSYYEALKALRRAFKLEDEMLNNAQDTTEAEAA